MSLAPKPSTVPSAALVVAVLATVALGTRTPPPTPPAERVRVERSRARPEPSPRAPLDLNRASPEELETLPRVGPALAARIVAHREANGPYQSLADLDRVRGIGPSLLEKLGPLVRFTPPAASPQNRSSSQPMRNPIPTESLPGTASATNP